jgi:uncharacterized protein YgbK (DUF1537 family)
MRQGPRRLDCLLVADDLTGACDAAVQFAVRGLRPVLVRLKPGMDAGDARVVAVSTESRDLAVEDVRGTLAAVASEFAGAGAGRVFKKIDSTLRGNPGGEVRAAMEAFGCEAAVVCPAFPAMGRVVEGGMLRVRSAPDSAPIDVAAMLERQSGVAWVRSLPGDVARALESGARWISVDAASQEHLERMTAAIMGTGRPVLWAGSAGLAMALACLLGEGGARPAERGLKGPAVFCLGSDHPVTVAQQEELLASRRSVLLDARTAARAEVEGALERGEHVVLRIPRGEVGPAQVRELVAGVRAGGYVLSGGDTASVVCAGLGAEGIELRDEVAAGVPRGVLQGGEGAGMSVVTKSGGFGGRETLVTVADWYLAPVG